MSDPRYCICGRDELLTGRQTLYASNACKARVWKERTGYRLQGTFERCQTPIPRQARPSDVRLTYADAVELVEFILTEQSHVQPERRPSLARSYVLARLSPKAAARAQDLGL